MNAYVFPGQGAQFPGMGKMLYEAHPETHLLFEKAEEILGFPITDIMFNGTDEALRQTRVTQPAVFLHSVILFSTLGVKPDMVAGHSLGEFSALVASGALKMEDALRLVYARAMAMQKACNLRPSTMAAVIGMEDCQVESVLSTITDEVVVPANFNSPGQVVISGTVAGVERAGVLLREAGAKRVLPLSVNGAFHSPLMEPARLELAEAIMQTHFETPICPIYQNVTAAPSTVPEEIRRNLLAQLTSPVRWTQSVLRMVADGADSFVEVGPGTVLQGLIKKIAPEAERSGMA